MFAVPRHRIASYNEKRFAIESGPCSTSARSANCYEGSLGTTFRGRDFRAHDVGVSAPGVVSQGLRAYQQMLDVGIAERSPRLFCSRDVLLLTTRSRRSRMNFLSAHQARGATFRPSRAQTMVQSRGRLSGVG